MASNSRTIPTGMSLINGSVYGLFGALMSHARPREWFDGELVPEMARFSYDHGPHTSPLRTAQMVYPLRFAIWNDSFTSSTSSVRNVNLALPPPAATVNVVSRLDGTPPGQRYPPQPLSALTFTPELTFPPYAA